MNLGAVQAGELVVVHVEDRINHTLAGHSGIHYESPPQSREKALALTRVLLGYTSRELDVGTQWVCPIAGGRRTVWLESQTSPNGLRQSTT